MRAFLALPLLLIACQSEPETGLIAPTSDAQTASPVAPPGDAPALGTVEGRVVDADGQGVPMVSVSIRSLRMGGATDGDGAFGLTGVPPGAHWLHASSAAGRDSALVDVIADDTAQVVFTLE
jgi:hypothetical protein